MKTTRVSGGDGGVSHAERKKAVRSVEA